MVSRIDGTGRIRITNDPHKDRVPVWSPGGENHLLLAGDVEFSRDFTSAFLMRTEAESDIWMLDYGGKNRTLS